jgi:hypothetical protein
VGATFGFDTYGIRTGNLADGLYVTNARASVTLSLNGSASIGVVGASAGASGTIRATQDPNAVIRLNRITSLDRFFSISGTITYKLSCWYDVYLDSGSSDLLNGSLSF